VASPILRRLAQAWPCPIGLKLSAIRTAAARHHFQTLDFLTHSFVEDGAGKRVL
jgi:hypothetical protein